MADLDRSIEFYRDTLRLTLVHVQEQDNAYTRSLVGYPDAVLRVAQFAVPSRPALAWGSGHALELVEYRMPRLPAVVSEIARPGASHLALEVDDIQEWHEWLTARSVFLVSKPNRITAGINEGGWAVYFRDPDSNVLELLQPPHNPNAPPVEDQKRSKSGETGGVRA